MYSTDIVEPTKVNLVESLDTLYHLQTKIIKDHLLGDKTEIVSKIFVGGFPVEEIDVIKKSKLSETSIQNETQESELRKRLVDAGIKPVGIFHQSFLEPLKKKQFFEITTATQEGKVRVNVIYYVKNDTDAPAFITFLASTGAWVLSTYTFASFLKYMYSYLQFAAIFWSCLAISSALFFLAALVSSESKSTAVINLATNFLNPIFIVIKKLDNLIHFNQSRVKKRIFENNCDVSFQNSHIKEIFKLNDKDSDKSYIMLADLKLALPKLDEENKKTSDALLKAKKAGLKVDLLVHTDSFKIQLPIPNCIRVGNITTTKPKDLIHFVRYGEMIGVISHYGEDSYENEIVNYVKAEFDKLSTDSFKKNKLGPKNGPQLLGGGLFLKPFTLTLKRAFFAIWITSCTEITSK